MVQSDMPLTRLLALAPLEAPSFFSAHSRLVTNGMNDNQPVPRVQTSTAPTRNVPEQYTCISLGPTWARLYLRGYR